ncbi:hypothetical protein SLE2022_249760 [Rubroshorea leprosula]
MKNPSSSSVKSRFTRRFLRALIKINRQKPSSSSSREIFLRYRRIRIAADKAMACVIGSRRAWSRAVLRRIKNQKGKRLADSLRRSNGIHGMKKMVAKEEDEISYEQENELRKLVPGVGAMDLCSMLDETAHYVMCLATQVQVMRKIVDFYST